MALPGARRTIPVGVWEETIEGLYVVEVRLEADEALEFRLAVVGALANVAQGEHPCERTTHAASAPA